MNNARRESAPLAIVGMACRLPGARSLDEFWQLVVSAGDATGELPESAFDRALYFDPRRGVRGKSYSAVGGLMPPLPFDNGKCKLSPSLVEQCDPAHLVACEVVHDALADAGYDPHAMPRVRSGVYFGHTGGSSMGGDVVYSVYVEHAARLLREVTSLECLSEEEIDAIAASITEETRRRRDHRASSPKLDCSPDLLARLIGEAYRLDGPCVVVDAACASSLQALALGARALRLGDADMVVVGGASCFKTDSLVLFSAAQSVSPGRSCPLDDEASGLVTAEGHVALVLKSLPRALADGDRVRCLIRGIGISSDGRGKSLWAPLKGGQAKAIRRAYPAPLGPEHMQYVEAHATSTQVGDATEMAALAEAFPQRTDGGPRIPLGSVKANIGHTLETAGVAGLVKVVLAMEHETIPPVANVSRPNSKVPWSELPFYLPQSPEPWTRPADGGPRRAAVNAFGIGGLNVHVVLEEHLARANAPDNGHLPRQAAPSQDVPIAVVGVGAILPEARDVAAFARLLQAGRDARTDVPPQRWDAAMWLDPAGKRPYRAAHARGGFIRDYQYDWRRHRVPPKQVANANPLQFMLLDATEEALRQAGCLDKPFDRDRVGVIVGTVFAGDFANELQAGLRLPEFGASLRQHLAKRGLDPSRVDQVAAEHEERLLKRMPALLDETGSFTSSTLASRITKTFDLKGGAMAIDAGCGSGLMAIGAAIDVLRSGECDMMICATGHRSMDPFAFEAMSRLGLLGGREGQHAFDPDVDGFCPGEGCAALVLKRLSDAERDGDKVLGVLHALGASADWKQRGRATSRAIRRALDASGASPSDLRAFEVQASPADMTRHELEEIGSVLSAESPQVPIQVNALVSQFGYLGAVHAAAGLIKGILGFARGEYPQGRVCNRPDRRLPFSDALRPQTGAVPLGDQGSAGQAAALVGVSAGRPEGPAYCMLVESVASLAARRRQPLLGRREAASGAQPSPRIVRLAAPSWHALRERLADASPESLHDPDYRFASVDRARVAVVCRGPADFAEKLRTLAAELPRPSESSRARLARHGIYWGEPHSASRAAAFVFPGQGSQYPGMLEKLIEELPEAQAACRRADAAMQALGYETFQAIAGSKARDLGTDVWKTQVSMLLADCILEDTLRQWGLTPSIVAGHSYGEFAAIVCAGVWSLTDAIRATRHRCQSVLDTMDGTGGMAAASASSDAVLAALEHLEGVYLANLNAPDQTVIAGRLASVRSALRRLKEAGHSAVMIDVPCPFHTPLMRPAAERFAQCLDEIPLRDSRLPVVSTATQRTMRSAGAIRKSLIDQLTQPTKYDRILEALLATRPALVLEVGPRQTLTRLNRKNHDAGDVVFLSCDVPASPGATALFGAVAQADCLGCLESGTDTGQIATRPSRAPARVLFHDATARRTSEIQSETQASAKTAKSRRHAGVGRTDASSGVRPGGKADAALAGAAPGAATLAVSHQASLRRGRLAPDVSSAAGTAADSTLPATRPSTSEKTANAPPVGPGEGERAQQAAASRVPKTVQVQVLEGSPGDRGLHHGGLLKRAIQHELAAFIDSSTCLDRPSRPIWSEPWNAELAALAQGAAVNCEALLAWNLVAEPLSALPASIGQAGAPRPAAGARHSLTLVQVRKPPRGIPYLAVGRPGRLAVPAGMNAAGLAISCEPLDAHVPPEDVMAVTAWMHEGLSSFRDAEEPARRMKELALAGRWGIGLKSAGSASRFWLHASADVRSVDAAVTREQAALHHMLDRDPSSMVLFDRQSGRRETLRLSDWLGGRSASPESTAADAAGRVMRRHVLRMSPAPRAAPAADVCASGSRVCLLGDSDVAPALQERLQQIGCRVTTVGPSDLPTAFDASREAEVPEHLVLLTESATDCPGLDGLAAARRFQALFFACRRWMAEIEARARTGAASLVAVTRMGGDFGFHSSAVRFAGGGITGLLKAIRREYPALRAKVLDVPISEPPDAVASELLAEVNSTCTDLEIGFRGGRRYAVAAVPAPAAERGARDVKRGGVWVVSGGGRGVTFAVARELARRFDAKLHLLGTAPIPQDETWRGKSEEQLRQLRREIALEARRRGRDPGEEWRRVERAMELDRNLKRLARERLHATYHRCDITDRKALAAVLDDVRSKDGPIHGVLHGAGVEAACRFTKKTEDRVRATIASKCDGCANLIALTREDPLAYFLAFGSTSGRFGGLGQTDYSLASDLLAKMVDRLADERPECRAVTFHWPAWEGVGMAARPESRMALQRAGITFMPLAEGVQFVIDELGSPDREREILVLDKPGFLDTDGTMRRQGRPCDPSVFRETPEDPGTSDRKRPAARQPRKAPPLRDVSQVPLIDRIDPGPASGRYVASAPLDADRDPFLTNHRLRGKPFLPAVLTAELFAEAASLTQPRAVFCGLRDLHLISGWFLEPGRPDRARIVMQQVDGGVRCELRRTLRNSRGEIVEEDKLQATAWVELGREPPRIEAIDPGRPVLAWTPFRYPDDFEIFHGPPLRALKQIDFVHGGGRAVLSCGPWQDLLGRRGGGSAMVNGALLDGCMATCGTFSYFMVNNKLEIPKSIASFRQARLARPGEVCTQRFFFRGPAAGGNLYDFTLIGEEGDAIFHVEGYQSTQLGGMR